MHKSSKIHGTPKKKFNIKFEPFILYFSEYGNLTIFERLGSIRRQRKKPTLTPFVLIFLSMNWYIKSPHSIVVVRIQRNELSLVKYPLN